MSFVCKNAYPHAYLSCSVAAESSTKSPVVLVPYKHGAGLFLPLRRRYSFSMLGMPRNIIMVKRP